MNTDEIINRLTKHANISEVYHKTSFHCIRTDKNGNNQVVDVDILDAGPDVNPLLRYHCVAKTEDGKIVYGNSASSIGEALNIVHWNELD